MQALVSSIVYSGVFRLFGSELPTTGGGGSGGMAGLGAPPTAPGTGINGLGGTAAILAGVKK